MKHNLHPNSGLQIHSLLKVELILQLLQEQFVSQTVETFSKWALGRSLLKN